MLFERLCHIQETLLSVFLGKVGWRWGGGGDILLCVFVLLTELTSHYKLPSPHPCLTSDISVLLGRVCDLWMAASASLGVLPRRVAPHHVDHVIWCLQKHLCLILTFEQHI